MRDVLWRHDTGSAWRVRFGCTSKGWASALLASTTWRRCRIF